MIDKFLSVAKLVAVMVGMLGALGSSQVKADNDNKAGGKIRQGGDGVDRWAPERHRKRLML